MDRTTVLMLEIWKRPYTVHSTHREPPVLWLFLLMVLVNVDVWFCHSKCWSLPNRNTDDVFGTIWDAVAFLHPQNFNRGHPRTMAWEDFWLEHPCSNQFMSISLRNTEFPVCFPSSIHRGALGPKDLAWNAIRHATAGKRAPCWWTMVWVDLWSDVVAICWDDIYIL